MIPFDSFWDVNLFRLSSVPVRIASAIDALESKYNGEGRVLIRPSGTEPLVRVMIEGRDQAEIDRDAKDLAELIEKTVL